LIVTHCYLVLGKLKSFLGGLGYINLGRGKVSGDLRQIAY
jgi:hypothetical protein